MEEHRGISEQRQELFGQVLTSLNNSSEPFLCFRLIPRAAQGVHTHQLVQMRSTKGYQACVRVMLISGETILVYPKLLRFIYKFSQCHYSRTSHKGLFDMRGGESWAKFRHSWHSLVKPRGAVYINMTFYLTACWQYLYQQAPK